MHKANNFCLCVLLYRFPNNCNIKCLFKICVNFPAFLFRCPALLVVGDTSPAVEAVVSDRFQYSVLKQQTETSNYL